MRGIRFVDAKGLFREIIPRDFVSPCPAPAAYPDEFAAAAFAFVCVQIPEFIQYGRMGPDIGEFLFFYLTAIQFEIAAGLYLSRVGNKTEGAPSETPSRHGM